MDSLSQDSLRQYPPQPIVLLGIDPNEHKIIEEMPRYADRLELEVSQIKKSSLKLNPFLYTPDQYARAFGSLPMWLRSFREKRVNIRSYDDEELLISSIDFKIDEIPEVKRMERELIANNGYNVFVERVYFYDGEVTFFVFCCKDGDQEGISFSTFGPDNDLSQHEELYFDPDDEKAPSARESWDPYGAPVYKEIPFSGVEQLTKLLSFPYPVSSLLGGVQVSEDDLYDYTSQYTPNLQPALF